MRKYTVGLILFFIGAITILGPSFAQEKRKTLRYSGIVQEVNVKDKTIIVGKEKKALAMLFDASRASFVNARDLQDLKAGDRVVMDYDAERGKTIAVTVTKEK